MTREELRELALDAHIAVYQVKRGKVPEEDVESLAKRLADLGQAVIKHLDGERPGW